MDDKQTFSITVGVNVVSKDINVEHVLQSLILDYLKRIGCNSLTMYYLNSNHVVIDGDSL